MGAPRVAVCPPDAPDWLRQAVIDGGGELVEPARAEAIVWGVGSTVGLDALLTPTIRWVQLPFAGVERFVHLVDDQRLWTCAKGVFAEPVAEHALALALAGMRHVVGYSRATTWGPNVGVNLLGCNVTILGGGAITESLVRLLQPFGCRITVVRSRVQPMDGVDDVVEADRYVDALADADLVVLALALTPDTEGMLSASELSQMRPHAWLVNVARGKHIVTDDLVWALSNGVIGGAALDVTEPEPLPDDHPLWSLPNCVVTPHIAVTDEMTEPLLAERVSANVRRFGNGQGLIGPVYPELGY